MDFIQIEDTDKRGRSIATYIQEVLASKNYIVHRKNAVTTSSIYIKIDYGLGGSIRISDHKGRSNLNYRFNVEVKNETNEVGHMSTPVCDRHFYPCTKVDKLINDVIKFRQNRIRQYGGTYEYNRLIGKHEKESLEKQKTGKGFWAGAYRITIDTDKRIEKWLTRNGITKDEMQGMVDVVSEYNEKFSRILKGSGGDWRKLPRQYLDLVLIRYKEILDRLYQEDGSNSI